MSKLLGHKSLNQPTCKRVPQIVPAEILDTCQLQRGLEPVIVA